MDVRDSGTQGVRCKNDLTAQHPALETVSTFAAAVGLAMLPDQVTSNWDAVDARNYLSRTFS